MSETNPSCAYQYTVKRGDSFYLIAHRTGVNLRDLLEANPNIPPARLTVGDVLCIPYGDAVQTPACEQPGDTSGTTEGNGGQSEAPAVPVPSCPPNRRTVVQNNQTLQHANPGTDLEEIRGGDVLCIPQENTPCTLPTTVTLSENDTLESVAAAYNVPVAALLRVNPCLAPGDFTAGVTIRLPE